MWHERTGDRNGTGRLPQGRRPDVQDVSRRPAGAWSSAGSDEMNLAVIHGLGRLYRTTGRATLSDA